MEQQHFRVKFSVGTKLLLSVVTLLLIVIGFLNISAIFLMREDKQAYLYQSKSTEANLAGREFVNTARHILDTLRLSLASLDPTSPNSQPQKDALKSVIDNQSDAILIATYFIDPLTGKLTPIAVATPKKESEEAQKTPEEFGLTEEWVKTILPELNKEGYGFLNLSKPEGIPALGVFLADLNLKTNPAGMPVALGITSMKKLMEDLTGINLSLINRSGWILFDTDSANLFSRKNISDDPLFLASTSSQLGNGTLEYTENGNRYLGSYVSPGLDLIVMTRAEWMKAMKATYELTTKFILLGCMAIAAAVIFAILFSKTLTAPINKLYSATKEVGEGKFDLNLDVRGQDEISALTGSFNVMSKKISELIEATKEKANLENELAIASTVQQTLIPPSAYTTDKINIRGYYQSASQCGGDWWGLFSVGDKLCVCIADATGHGLPCALITASARSCFSVLHKLAQEDPAFSFSPSKMLSYANRVIFETSMGQIMMTFFIGVVDFSKNTFTYSSAGHNPPWLFKKSSGKYVLKSLVAVGQRLGEALDSPKFEEKTVPLDAEDMLFLYTDGLMEGKSLAGELYGKKRTRAIIESSLTEGPDKVVENLMADFMKYNEGKPLDDDVTVAVARILRPVANA